MDFKIYISTNIARDQPSLIPRLHGLLAPHSEAAVSITTVSSLLPSVRSIEWDDDTGLLGPKLKMIWLDGRELQDRISQGTLVRLVENFQDYHAQDGPSQRTLLLLYQCPPERRTQYEIQMCRLVLQFSCLYCFADTLEDAAAAIYSYTCGFWEMIAYPTSTELQEDYRNMLLVLPSMTLERADLVTSRYSCWRHLIEAFVQLEPQVQSGQILLNSALFSLSVDASEPEEYWVQELYAFLTSDDPDMAL
ncbi:hypothetical protein AAF712_006039 [Marasmius tenuissimus]|uniref:Uncharacterized protein n=1 Tax=Marasmius tenuissimus TaxID=585030 RepID=A0ABR3A0D4_9AGAR